MLPDKTTGCHRTGFEKTCFTCVTEHGCRLWKQVRLDHDPQSGRPCVDHYDCLDSLDHLYKQDGLRRQTQTTATIDALRKEVHDANDSGMASAMMGINRYLRDGPDHRLAIAGSTSQKMIEGDA